MSVPEGERRKTRLEVFIKAQYLATYTIQITSNRNRFPPKLDEKITNDIVKTARDIYAKSWEANTVNGEKDWETRNAIQKESIRLCGQLLVKDGKMTREKFEQCYQSWREHASKGNSRKLLLSMDALCRKLCDDNV